MKLRTVRGYDLGPVVSALQKMIRRGDARRAVYFAVELFESGYAAYAWRRLLIISAEDCAGLVTQEVEALYRGWIVIDKHTRGKGIVLIAKAALVLARADKSRDADHATCLVYDQRSGLSEADIRATLADVRAEHEDIPDEAYDCHTHRGRAQGLTRRDFFLAEHDALQPHVPGLFDEDVERLRRGEIDVPVKGGRLAPPKLKGVTRR